MCYRSLLKVSSLVLAVMAQCILGTALPLLAQCQAHVSTVPVPGSFADAGATCVPAVLVDLGNLTVVDRANHLLWAKEVVYLGGSIADFENYCSELLLGGQTGWYLPDVAQLQTLLPPVCQAAMDGCGTGSPDYPGFNGIMWSSSGVSPESYYCPGYGCPYYGWQVATGLGTDFGTLTYVPGTPPRKRVDAGTYENSASVRCVHSGLELAITIDPMNPVNVPAGTTLSMNSILTHAHLLLKLTDYDTFPVSGVLLSLRSDRPTLDQVVGPTRNTGVDGSADAYVETLDQTSNSTIDSTTPLVWTDPKGVVTWLPARYVTPFYTTCYRTDLESDFPGPFIVATKWSWCNTTPTGRTYRAAFMKDIQTQGSGVSVLNETIQYLTSGNCYYISSCPTTSTGLCATVGVTAAVDNKVSPVIPMGAAIDIDTLGGRVAQDTGSRKTLVGYHIDIYNGLGAAACAGWTSPNLGVTFVHY